MLSFLSKCCSTPQPQDPCIEITPGLFLNTLPVKKRADGTTPPVDLKQLSELVASKNGSRSLKHIVSTAIFDEFVEELVDLETFPIQDLKRHQIEREVLRVDKHDEPLFCLVEIDQALRKINKIIVEEKQAVYIHCKAGCELSALIGAAYLAAFVTNPSTQKKFTAEEAMQFLQRKHNALKIGKEKLKQLEKIVNFVTVKAPKINAIFSNIWSQDKAKEPTTETKINGIQRMGLQ